MVMAAAETVAMSKETVKQLRQKQATNICEMWKAQMSCGTNVCEAVLCICVYISGGRKTTFRFLNSILSFCINELGIMKSEIRRWKT